MLGQIPNQAMTNIGNDQQKSKNTIDCDGIQDKMLDRLNPVIENLLPGEIAGAAQMAIPLMIHEQMEKYCKPLENQMNNPQTQEGLKLALKLAEMAAKKSPCLQSLLLIDDRLKQLKEYSNKTIHPGGPAELLGDPRHNWMLKCKSLFQ